MPELNLTILSKLKYRLKLRSGTISLLGRKFSKLTPLGYVGSLRSQGYWLFLCDCGSFTIAEGMP